MKETVISFKLAEHFARLEFANNQGNTERARREVRTLIVLKRMLARSAVGRVVGVIDDLRAVEREQKKLKQAGISMPLLDAKVDKLYAELKEAKKGLATIGEALATTLDIWQELGASLVNLCNLCNRDYEQVLKEIKQERVDERFSSLIFVYNLDYKDLSNRGWIDYDVDAPLTHAVKEYFLDQMIHTPEGRAASHRALEACFPGIMEGALMEVTDADGVRRLIDKDGVEVATLDGEEEHH